MPHAAPQQHCPSPRELDDLELLLNGGLSPLDGFNRPGSAITLNLPEALAASVAQGSPLELVDPEGLPLARVTDDGHGLAVTALSSPEYGPFRRLYRAAEDARSLAQGRSVAVITAPLTDRQHDALRSGGPVLLLVLAGYGAGALPPVGLIRATLAGATDIDAEVVVVPLAARGYADDELREQVVQNYAGASRIVDLPEGGTVLPAVAAIVDEVAPPRGEQGLVIFFTGLSGSGKSTLAQALMDRLLERGGRTLTSLDGDVVRRNLSAGLTFSKADRETNIRRIGWVAAEISRHGGVAVCSPIAPFDETRQQVRRYVADAGGAFFLVHVATPLEECERRDRKGLYAKARAGEIPEFTGISSPYEEPDDADVRVDTTGRTIDAALDDVLQALAGSGYLDLTGDDLASAGRTTTPAPKPAPVPTASPADDASRPLRVLFVCTANICRSPYMELRARDLVGPDPMIEFAGAGTHGFDSHPVDDTIAATLSARGVSPGATARFRSRPLTKDLIDSADLILTAEASHRIFLLDETPGAFRKAFTLGQFAESLDRVDPELHGAELVAAVGQRRAGAVESHDVADPYRRGRAAAEKCADQIDDLLGQILPRLTGRTLA